MPQRNDATRGQRMTPIANKVLGSLKQSDEADANREEIPKIWGQEVMRELLPLGNGSVE